MHPSQHPPAARVTGPLGLIAILLGGAAVLSCIGLGAGSPRSQGPIWVISQILGAGLFALAYILGAWGLGRPLVAWLARPANRPSRLWIQLALGTGAMLWISHMLGVCGLLSGPGATPRVAGWGAIGLGLLLLIDQIVRGPLRPERWPVLPISVVLFGPAIALMIVAAASPPGSLWSTEFGAFDVLSYHLQLPKEWAAGTHLWPTDHNVYSYLPSYMEAAYLHLGAIMPGSFAHLEPVQRLMGGDGAWVFACQFLHVGMSIVGAMLAGRAARAAAIRCGTDPRAATALGAIAGALLLGTPWMVVVSTLAYNEAGLVAMLAGAMLIVLETDLRPAARGAAAGLLVGLACGCKPTALFMAGPLVGLIMLGTMPRADWLRSIAAGAAGGLVAVAPWLARNALASGNPVFPFATAIFGKGHWTPEQIERYARNHHAPPGTTIADRFVRLFSGEFGLTHTQWGIILVALVVGAISAIIWSRSPRLALLLLAGMAIQSSAWMFLTHLQSRFLIPLVVPAVLAMTLGGAALLAWVGRLDESHKSPSRRSMIPAALSVLALAPLSQALRSVTLFLEQNDGAPNQLLTVGVGGLTGTVIDGDAQAAPPEDRERIMDAAGPVRFINIFIRPQDQPDSGVYLLGDSTPLYFLGASGISPSRSRARAGSPVVYHTTWDSPFLTAHPQVPSPASSPDPVHLWSRSLRDRGIRYVLINYDELARLIARDRYYDPAITLESLAQWIVDPAAHLRPIRAWRRPGAAPAVGTGSELFEIVLPGAAYAPPASPAADPQRRPRAAP